MNGKRFSGERLRDAREAKGLSRMDLIRKIHPFRMDPQTIIKYERGEATPSVDRVLVLARALGVSVEDLCDTPRC